ncbi:MAG: hypothetical protein MJ094_03035 [Saccharofermentans sp.]|nr:hypothetical protein [Saccharofermentans sp.]
MFKRNSKTVGLISVLLAGAVFMSACSVDMNGIGDAFRNLGENLNEAVNESSVVTEETTVSDEAIIVETDIIEAEVVEEAEPTSTPVPEVTSTPVPTATPAPQRVDFSELSSDLIYGTISVETEEFIETSHAEDDDELVLASFSGERVLLSSVDDIAVVTAVNMMLDGFYMEAEGLYNRAVNETAASYTLTADEIPSPVNVTIHYETFFNGRLLGVIMSYEVEQENVVSDSVEEYVMYDLYTGQYIVPELLFADVDGLYLDICGDIAHESEDTRDKASDYRVIWIAASEEDDDDIPAIALVLHAGEIEVYEIELADYEQYISRNGRILLGFNRFLASENAEEEIEDEVVDEVEVDEEED